MGGDFYELVKTKLQGNEVVLDIGTAEGNRFMGLSKYIKKGLGNNTNIFPSQMQEFPMIDISLKDQQKIVDEIKAELDKQGEINKNPSQKKQN